MRLHRVFAAFVIAVGLIGLGSAANASILVSIDKSTQRMSVTVDGELRWTWPVSTGRARYDTPNGRYTAFRMEAEHYSKEWDDAPMPHSIFFTQIGHAIHGTNQTKRLGQPASHGCVRLAPEHAAELFALVKEEGLSNTKVVVEGHIPSSAPLVADRIQRLPGNRTGGGPAMYEVPDGYGLETGTIPEPGQRGAVRVYGVQPGYRGSQNYDRRRAYRSPPRIIYDQRVEIVEDVNINGVWVRRHYYRRARPQDFYGYR